MGEPTDEELGVDASAEHDGWVNHVQHGVTELKRRGATDEEILAKVNEALEA